MPWSRSAGDGVEVLDAVGALADETNGVREDRRQ
jgi:hypothetical protein